MNIGIFILNDTMIKEQISIFYRYFINSELNNHRLIVFVKEARKIEEEKKKRNMIKRLVISVITGRIFKSIYYRTSTFFKKNKSKVFSELPISIITIDSINSTVTQELIAYLKLDYGIFILYDEIVRKKTLSLLKSPINLHPAPLPEFKGCQPIHWLLKEKQLYSCMTMHRMIEGIDEGDIVFETPFSINSIKSINYNSRKCINTISLTLMFGLRRLFLFDKHFGISQSLKKGINNYYNRPVKK